MSNIEITSRHPYKYSVDCKKQTNRPTNHIHRTGNLTLLAIYRHCGGCKYLNRWQISLNKSVLTFITIAIYILDHATPYG